MSYILISIFLLFLFSSLFSEFKFRLIIPDPSFIISEYSHHFDYAVPMLPYCRQSTTHTILHYLGCETSLGTNYKMCFSSDLRAR